MNRALSSVLPLAPVLLPRIPNPRPRPGPAMSASGRKMAASSSAVIQGGGAMHNGGRSGGWSMGGGGDADGHRGSGYNEEWRVTSEIHLGPKKPPQRQKQMQMESDFSGIDMNETCGHFRSPILRVCTEGFDAGHRFLMCSSEGYASCGFMKWVDEEWKGRSRTVIHKLVEENIMLKNALQQKDNQILALKEGSMAAKVSLKQKIKIIQRREVLVLAVVAAFSIVYVVSRV